MIQAPKALSKRDQATLRAALKSNALMLDDEPEKLWRTVFPVSRKMSEKASQGEPLAKLTRERMIEAIAEYRSYKTIKGQQAE